MQEVVNKVAMCMCVYNKVTDNNTKSVRLLFILETRWFSNDLSLSVISRRISKEYAFSINNKLCTIYGNR